MSRWRCGGCETRYALRLTRCPRCHTTSFHEEGPMPKISRSRGATNAGVAKPPTPKAAPAPKPEPTAVVSTKATLTEEQSEVLADAVRTDTDPLPFGAVREPEPAPPEGGEPSSPGNSSSPSTAPQKTTSKQSKTPRPKRARLGSRSSQAPKESSSPGSPATGGPKTDALTDD